MDQFLGAGNPGRYYKRHAREYMFRNTVVASFTARAQAIQRPGAHSNSSNPGDFENISKADKLAIKLLKERLEYQDQLEASRLQEQEAKRQKKEVSNALVPPPAPLPGAVNVLSSLSSNVPKVSPHPPATKKVLSFLDDNSQLEVVDLLDEDVVGKENASVLNKKPPQKKKPVVMTGNDASVMFYDAISKPDPSFDRLANMMADFQRAQVEAEARREKEKIEAEERRVLLEERSQHMRLLEMLHAGTISLEMYNAMKPNGF